MSDTTVKKIASRFSPRGPQGQKYLAAGKSLSMRLWEAETPGETSPSRERPYETLGFALRGRAELHHEGQVVVLEAGDCWVVPRHGKHHYRILEEFTAVEATSPPAELQARDGN
jgi:quercetin dioxygenase-like cupin family protein